MEARSNPKRSPNQNQTLSDTACINILYITTDLVAADWLTYALHRAAPGQHLEISAPDIQRVDRLLRAGGFEIVLLDNSVAAADSLHLVTHLDSQKLTPALVAIIGADENFQAHLPLEHFDDYIVKGPNFVNGLADVLKRAFIRYKMGIKRRTPIPHPSDVVEPTTEGVVARNRAVESAGSGADVFPGASAPQGLEQRVLPRKQVNIQCKIVWNGNICAAFIRDISEVGAFLEISPAPPAGSRIHISLGMDNAIILQEAIVIHEGWYLGDTQNFFGCGIQFKNLTEKAASLLKMLVTKSSKPAMSKVALTP
jgi:hypothetical protein